MQWNAFHCMLSKMVIFIPYHVIMISELNDQNVMRCYIYSNIQYSFYYIYNTIVIIIYTKYEYKRRDIRDLMM
jgi:hypothetical protein